MGQSGQEVQAPAWQSRRSWRKKKRQQKIGLIETCLIVFLIFYRTRREKEDWLESLFDAIKELYQRKSSLRIGREILRPCDSEIGKKRPHLLKLEAIHKCMECSQPFSMMRKKYNCRACGIVSIFCNVLR